MTDPTPHSSSSSARVSPPLAPHAPPIHSRNSSQHVPFVPSRLRENVVLSPEETMARSMSTEHLDGPTRLTLSPPALQPQHNTPAIIEPDQNQWSDLENDSIMADIDEPSTHEVNARTSLLGNYNHHNRVCGLRNCNHGTFSPRAPSIRSTYSSLDSSAHFGGRYGATVGDDGGPRDAIHGILGDAVADSLTGNKGSSTTRWLAHKHGINSPRFMYFSYYFPFIKWVRQYRWSWLKGDLIAALTMASFYIPMSLSYASNLGHIPPINGLYSFVFSPLIYALLGTCPQMVVGPEAAGSLLVGSVVRNSIESGGSGDDDNVVNAQIAGVVTGIAGAVIFVAGLSRLGFLDSVLSRPFLRGFISAIGFVIFVDQLIPELGLAREAKEDGDVAHGSSAQKLVFLVRNISKSHGLTAAVSFTSFGVIMLFRSVFPFLSRLIGETDTQSQNFETKASTTLSLCCILSRSIPCRLLGSYSYLGFWMGQAGVGCPRKGRINIGNKGDTFPLAIYIPPYEAYRFSIEHIVLDRPSWILRVVRGRKKLRRRHPWSAWHDFEC